jgi:hypothetical protein
VHSLMSSSDDYVSDALDKQVATDYKRDCPGLPHARTNGRLVLREALSSSAFKVRKENIHGALMELRDPNWEVTKCKRNNIWWQRSLASPS